METRTRQIVMVVDDSILICEQTKKALEGDEGIFLCTAHTGEEALDVMEQYQPDLILLDVVLPDADGYELFERLREIDKNGAVIIFLTSKDKDDDVVKGFKLGACDYIKKPFVAGELYSRVLTHLSIKKQKDELNQLNQELKSNMEKLNYMAFRDGLTGLYNRRYVVDDLLEDIKSYNRKDVKNVLILADIDDFKRVNDTYGHDAGDMTLVCVSNILENVCRRHRVIRWGGEEFLVVLFAVTEDEAFNISEEIRKEVEAFKIFHENDEFSCTITLGLQVFDDNIKIDGNIICADRALYAGKKSGKNCSVWYREE